MQREAHEWLKESIRKLDPDEVLQCYAPEERLKGLDPDLVLNRYDPEERLKGLAGAGATQERLWAVSAAFGGGGAVRPDGKRCG